MRCAFSFMNARVFVLLFCLAVRSGFGQGTLLWDESVNGPLGQAYVAPTSLGMLSSGTNSILGSVEAVPNQFGWTLANDYFTFQVPTGFQVQGLNLTVTQQILAWLGTFNYGTEIGYRYTSVSENLLPFFWGSQLPTGSYGMYISDDNLQSVPTAVNYRLDFVVTPVPEPSTWALFMLGSLAFSTASRRRRT